MANSTIGGGECPHPFLPLADFPYTAGCMFVTYNPYVNHSNLAIDESSRLCAPLPASGGSLFCCLPCPMTDWVYPDSKYIGKHILQLLTRIQTSIVSRQVQAGSTSAALSLLFFYCCLSYSSLFRKHVGTTSPYHVGLMSVS